MILSAILALSLTTAGRVIEVPNPTAETVNIQAIVRLPELSGKQRALLQVVAGCLADGTDTYSRAQIDDVSLRVGQRMRVSVMEDHLRVSYEVLAPDIGNGLSIVASALKEPTLADEGLAKQGDALQYRRYSYWRQALAGTVFEMPRYSRKDIVDLRALVFRPENVTLAVTGKFTSGMPTEKWETMEATWKVGRPPRPVSGEGPAKGLEKLPGTLSVLEMRGPAFSATEANLPTRVLALLALGTGKGSSLFRVPREKLGWSYRQEAVLSPTTTGFVPRLLVVQAGTEEIEKKGELLRAELLADVENWKEEDRLRAVGMAEAALIRGIGVSPFYFLPDRPVGAGWEDTAFLDAYWSMKTGERWDPRKFVGQLGFVDLADLKTAAREMLASSLVRIYRGS